MRLPRRTFFHLAAGAAALPVASRFAWAGAYPTRPVRIVVGFAAGGSTDILAHLVGQALSERFGQPFVIENRPGVGGNIAVAEVVDATPDGHTLLLGSTNNAINATLYDKLGFDFLRDIAPVASIGRQPNVMTVHPSFPARTVAAFIAYAKANPGTIRMASAGVGSSSHAAGELFRRMTDVSMVHVPYAGGDSALASLLEGEVQVFFGALPGSIEHIRAGRLRALAVTSALRSEALPEIPTIAATVPGYETQGWIGLGAPKDTPGAIVGMLNVAINASLYDPSMQSRFAALGAVPASGTSAAFGRFVAAETGRWASVIHRAKSNAA